MKNCREWFALPYVLLVMTVFHFFVLSPGVSSCTQVAWFAVISLCYYFCFRTPGSLADIVVMFTMLTLCTYSSDELRQLGFNFSNNAKSAMIDYFLIKQMLLFASGALSYQALANRLSSSKRDEKKSEDKNQ